MSQQPPDEETLREVEEVAALDRQEDFHDIPLLTAHHLEALWDWPARRGSLVTEDGSVRAPHAWNELPDGGILDAQGPSGMSRLFPGDPRLMHYREAWFPWLEEVPGTSPGPGR